MPNEMVTLGEGALAFLSKFGEGVQGTIVKFSKEGKFVKRDGDTIPEGTECVCVYDQIQGGWIKFNGAGQEPERRMGPVFSGFVPPPREELGDDDEAQWRTGLNGKPQDPWQFQMLLPLQDVKSGELYIFATSSKTGRQAVYAVMYACQAMMKKDPGNYPVIRLTRGSFAHKDRRVGEVNIPKFPMVGVAPKNDHKMAATDLPDHFDDEVPF